MSTVSVKPDALVALQNLAADAGVPASEYLDALLNYAWSQKRRPGSWEACCPFDYNNYQRPEGYADRWWK